MNDIPERMTTLEFLRWFAANHSRVQLGAVTATIAFGIIVLTGGLAAAPLPAWAKATAIAAVVVAYLASAWYVLGIQRVQRWVIGQ